jgi:signal transduction histidine kinase
MSFRARLMVLLTAFLLLTIIFVLILDQWAQKGINEEIEAQNARITEAVNSGYDDFMRAFSLALRNLDSDEYMFEQIKREDLPRTVEFIIVTDKTGKVKDTTLERLADHSIPVPQEERLQILDADPVEDEADDHEHAPKTYYLPFTTDKGLYWIVIVTTQQGMLNEIRTASTLLAEKNRVLSNYRLWSTTGLLLLALLIAVIIGWRFTQPIGELASAARRVAAGDLNFRVNIDRPDEVGQLANTFNEMIAGLKSKRELEERLNQSERAAVIGRLTQAVAHEIRNPLNVINLSIDHVSSRYGPEDEARRKQFTRMLSSIKDEIARLKRLVSDLLNYGRPARLAVETVDVKELVDETISLIKPQADAQGVEVELEQIGEPVEVRGDPERLKSCFSNLAINALQAMPAGGHLKASVERRDGLVEVSISDTGVGISEESQGKIFEPYFSTKQTGFGLGLAVTKTIVEEHKGTIEVESEVNRGTTFKVRLPAQDQT